MKISDVTETLITASPEKIMKNIFSTLSTDNMKHVGDIEYYQVFHRDNLYIITKDGDKVGYAVVDIIEDIPVVEQLYISDDYRGNGVGEMFILYLKRAEGFEKIKFGYQQSFDAMKMLKRIGHRFTMYWEKDGVTMEYNAENNEVAYSYGGNTGWQLVLENTMDMKAERFFDSSSPKMSMFYECLLWDNDED